MPGQRNTIKKYTYIIYAITPIALKTEEKISLLVWACYSSTVLRIDLDIYESINGNDEEHSHHISADNVTGS